MGFVRALNQAYCRVTFSNAISEEEDVSDELFCNCTATVDPAVAATFDCRPTETSKFTLLGLYRACSGIAATSVSIYLPSRADFKLDSHISCASNINVTVASSGEGATLDGQEQTGLFSLGGGCSLTLRGLTLVNGRASSGGVVYAKGAGDVEIIDSTVSGCSAGFVRRVELAALQQRCTAAGRERERATPASPRSLLATAGRRCRLRVSQRYGLANRHDRDELLC